MAVMPVIVEPVGAFIVAAAGVGLTLRYTQYAGLIDVPNDRSSHTIPTPRGGGIALVGTVLGLSWMALAQSSIPAFVVGAFVLAVAVVAGVGWLDDSFRLSAAVRFPAHLFSAIALGVLLNFLHPIAGPLNFAWLLWWMFWTIAAINIVNFMDGIDGIAGSQGVVYGLFLFALAPTGVLASRYGAVLAAACLGFLVWNWAPAKIFMGDVGSGSLGLLFVFGGMLALNWAPPSVVFLPLFPLFLDALVTLIQRARRGEKLTIAHRGHLYQRLANGRAGHSLVALGYALAASAGALVGIAVQYLDGSTQAVWISIYIAIVWGARIRAESMLKGASHGRLMP